VTSTDTLAPRRRLALSRRLTLLALRYSIFIALAAWMIAMSLASEHFLTATNLLNVARQAAPVIVIGVGMTFVMATAGIDLSVGSTVAVVSVVSTALLAAGVPAAAVIGLVVLLGAALGAVNGGLVVLGVPAFIVTLATLVSYRGMAFVLSDGYAKPIADGGYLWFGRGDVLGLNAPFAIALAVAAVGWFLLSRSPFGLHALAVGGREEAARVMGLPIRRIKLSVYALTGALAGLAGVIVSARLSNGSPNAGQMLELDVIAAVVLGGTSLFGGQATILGTIVGALLLNFIRNGLNLMNVNPFWVQVVTGVVLIAAVVLNTLVNRNLEAMARVPSEEADE
jgi:ribose/xylose/arabinose/galactoside ABC-type transport system permease subunit